MEPGTDRRELVASWRRLERRRRAASHLAVGTALVLGGVLALVFGVALPTQVCSQGAGYAGCVVSDPGPAVRVVLVLWGLALAGAGAVSVRRGVGTER